MTVALYSLFGAIAGFLAGLFGIGGGIILVPIFLFAFELEGISLDIGMHMAIATSLSVVAFNALSATWQYYKAGQIITSIASYMGMTIILGAILGAWSGTHIQAHFLQIILGIFMLTMGIQVLNHTLPSNTTNHTFAHPSKTTLMAGGCMIGYIASILGIGGGALNVPFLLHLKVPLQKAIGISTACTLPLSIVGALSYIILGFSQTNLPALSIGYVYWPAFLGSIATGFFSVKWGVKLNQKLPAKTLQRLFATLLFGVALKFLWPLMTAIF